MSDIDDREALLAKEKELFELQKGLVGDTLFQDVRRRLIDNAKLWLGLGGAYLAFLTFLGLDAYLESSAQEVVRPIKADVEKVLGDADTQLAKIEDFSEKITDLELQIDTLTLELNKSESLANRQKFDRFFDEQFKDRMDNTIQDVQGTLTLCWGKSVSLEEAKNSGPGIRFEFDGKYRTDPAKFFDAFSLSASFRRQFFIQDYASSIAGLSCVEAARFLDRFNSASPTFLDIRELPPLEGITIANDRFNENKEEFEDFWSGVVAAYAFVEVNRENFFFVFNQEPFFVDKRLDADTRVVPLGKPVVVTDQTSSGETFKRAVLPLVTPTTFPEMNE